MRLFVVVNKLVIHVHYVDCYGRHIPLYQVSSSRYMPSRSTPPCLRKNVRPYTAGVKWTRQETRPERSPFF